MHLAQYLENSWICYISYRMSIVTIGLSLTIRPQFAASVTLKSKEGGPLWGKIWGGTGNG